MIIVTPNPAIDRTMLLDNLESGAVHRASQVIIAPGGKGLNAARTARILGADPLCMGFLGGHSGNQLAELASDEGFRCSWTWTETETRTCVIIAVKEREPTVVNEQGQKVPAATWNILGTELIRQAQKNEIIAFSGSLPLGSEAVFPALLERLKQAGLQVWVDSSGPALKAALGSKIEGIKVNLAEACALMGAKAENARQAMIIARQIHSSGINQVALTLGEIGAVYYSAENHFFCESPKVKPVSNVGSGDAFFGAFLLGLENGAGAQAALLDGIAAGAANTLSPGGGKFSPDEFSAMKAAIRVTTSVD